MHPNQRIPAGGMVILLLVILNAVIMEQGLVSHPKWYKLTIVTFPLLVFSVISSGKKLL